MERHREVLEVARRLVVADGISALTMQRVADEVGCGVGTLYRSFPSKGALIAELQRDALDVVNASLRVSQARIDRFLSDRGVRDPAALALARLVGAGRFWIGAEVVFPHRIELVRRTFSEPQPVFDDDEGARVAPAALRLLDLAQRLVDDAVADGAIGPGPSTDRAIVLIAGATGVLMTSALARWEEDLFEGRRLAVLLLRDLMLAWGASPERLDEIDDVMAALAEHGLLVPEILP